MAALIGLLALVLVVAWTLGHIKSKPPIVIASSACIVALTWVTDSATVCLVSVLVAGIVVALVEAYVEAHTEETP